jgi:hypothetical protein
MMRRGLASPGEIARAGAIAPDLVRNWRARAGIDTDQERRRHVRKLLMRETDDPAA